MDVQALVRKIGLYIVFGNRPGFDYARWNKLGWSGLRVDPVRGASPSGTTSRSKASSAHHGERMVPLRDSLFRFPVSLGPPRLRTTEGWLHTRHSRPMDRRRVAGLRKIGTTASWRIAFSESNSCRRRPRRHCKHAWRGDQNHSL